MGGSPKHLLCTWHVDRAWQTELRAKVKDTVVAAEIYKMLRIVLQQTGVDSFEDYLCKLNTQLSKLSMEFAEYFKQEWAARPELRAYCHRKCSGINTNMAVEAFHRSFKYGYLKGRVNKRVDKCLHYLLQYAKDKSFDRVIKLTKGKATSKIKLIKDRHNTSKSLCIDEIQEDGDSSWTVASTSTNDLKYTIMKQASRCLDEACNLKCTDCNICIHQFICDCPDSLIHHTICKHVHLLQRHLNDPKKKETPAYKDTSYEECEVKHTTSQLKDKVCSHDVQTARRTLQETLRLFADELDNCENKHLLNEISKKVKASHYLFKSLLKQPASLSPIKPMNTSPANKKINPQLRFRSTKKKRKRTTKVRFAKPNQGDCSALFGNQSNTSSKCFFLLLPIIVYFY